MIAMKEISREDVENCSKKCDEFFRARMDLYHVFVQQEYLDYFSKEDEVYCTGHPGEYHGLAKDCKRNIIMLEKSTTGFWVLSFGACDVCGAAVALACGAVESTAGAA